MPSGATVAGPRFVVSHWIAGFALLALVVLVYLPILRYGLVYDDSFQIAGNYRLTSWSYVPGYFTTHLWAHYPGIVEKWYRPIFLVWLRLCHVVFGTPGNAWHWGGVVAHVGATAALLALVRRMTGNFRVALLSAALFGIHPIHVESVAWISAVGDSLATAFLVLSLYFYVGRKHAVSVLSLLFALLALFTKEASVVIAGLVFACAWTRSSFKRAALDSIPYVLCTAAYFGCRYAALGTASVHENRSMSTLSAVLTWPRMLATYVGHVIWPVHLSVAYDVPVERSVWPLLLLVVALGGAVFLLRRGGAMVRFGAAWFALTLLPALVIWYLPGNDFLHDRYLYIPSVGLALAAAPLFARLTFRPPQVIAVALIAGLLCIGTVSELPPWENDIALFERAVETAPLNTTVRNNLAVRYMSEKRYDDAAAMLRRAIEIDPRDPDLYFNLGNCYELSGNFGKAAQLHAYAEQLATSQGKQGPAGFLVPAY